MERAMVEVYRVKQRYSSFEFVKVMADKVTASSVFIQGNRAAKAADGVQYFDDFASAKQYAESFLRRQIEAHQKQLDSAEYSLKQIKSVTEETIAVSDTKW